MCVGGFWFFCEFQVSICVCGVHLLVLIEEEENDIQGYKSQMLEGRVAA